THLEGKYFDRVQSLQGSETDGVNGAEQENHGDCSLRCRVICFTTLSICQSSFNRWSGPGHGSLTAANCDEAIVIPTHMTVQAAIEKRNMGRRPTCAHV